MKKQTERDKTWNIFSVYIRLRDTDSNGWGVCSTSGVVIHYNNSDAGHFIPRGNENTFLDEVNVHIQSKLDNRFKYGCEKKMAKYIDNKYGKGTSEQLRIKSKILCRRNDNDYVEIRKYYQNKISELLETKNFSIKVK